MAQMVPSEVLHKNQPPPVGLALLADRQGVFQKSRRVFESWTAATDLHFEPEIFGKAFADEQKTFGKSGRAKPVEAGGGKYQGPLISGT